MAFRSDSKGGCRAGALLGAAPTPTTMNGTGVTAATTGGSTGRRRGGGPEAARRAGRGRRRAPDRLQGVRAVRRAQLFPHMRGPGRAARVSDRVRVAVDRREACRVQVPARGEGGLQPLDNPCRGCHVERLTRQLAQSRPTARGHRIPAGSDGGHRHINERLAGTAEFGARLRGRVSFGGVGCGGVGHGGSQWSSSE